MEVYADYNSSAPLCENVKKEMPDWMERIYGNPSNLHSLGLLSRGAIESARSRVAKTLNCRAGEIYFTSGGTESNALGILGFFLEDKNVKTFVCSQVEHSSVLGQAEGLKERKLKTHLLPVNSDGVFCLNEAFRCAKERPCLFSVMLANNETGVIQPIKELVGMSHQLGSLVHCDAVQAYGKIPIDLKDLGVDLASVSGHKVGALKGVGALFVRKGLKIKSILGHGSHEQGFRPGTENLLGIMSMGAVASQFSYYENVANLRSYFEEKLMQKLNVIVAGLGVARVPNTSSVIFPKNSQDFLLAGLDMKGVRASAGSACKAGMSEPSHVLKAMGVAPENLKSVVRFSFGPNVTKEQLDYVIDTLVGIVK